MAIRERSSLLVITRDGSVRAVLSRFLRSRGFVVKTAAGPDEARVICERWRPDLVVVEALERFDSSLAMLRELRETVPAIAGAPMVLGCKATPPCAAEHSARELGVAEIVLEPFAHMDELVLVAAKILASLEPKPAPEPEPAAPARPAEAARPLPCPASGRLAISTVIELLAGCQAAGVTGRLTLRHGATRVAIGIERGSPCHAESSDPEGSFEAFLERSGRVGPEERRLLGEASPGATLRQAILGQGLLGPHELFRALASHLRELVVGCVGWEDGDYELEQGAGCGDDATPIGLDATTLIRAGIERHYDLARLERALAASDEARLRISAREGGGIGRGDLCLSTQEARLFELASRGSTVGEICKAAGNRVSGLRFLLALVVMDVIVLERAPEASRAEATVAPEAGEAPREADGALTLPESLELADVDELPPPSSMPAATAGAGEPLEVPELLELAEPREPPRPSAPPETSAPAEEEIEAEIRRLATADYFALFDLARDAATDEVHAAFRRMAARFRPEALIDVPAPVRDEGIAVYHRLLEGYRVLANAQQRERYLAELRRGPGLGARPKPEGIRSVNHTPSRVSAAWG